jgi:hypothetical protein
MDLIAAFANYAMAFEVAFESDDWSGVESSFTEDVVYETFSDPPFAARHEGRDSVLAAMKRSLDEFDRRFDARENPEMLAGPELRDGAVWIRWRVGYRVVGAPPLIVEGEETAEFDGGRICRLEDRISSDEAVKVLEWMEAHEARLKQPD